MSNDKLYQSIQRKFHNATTRKNANRNGKFPPIPKANTAYLDAMLEAQIDDIKREAEELEPGYIFPFDTDAETDSDEYDPEKFDRLTKLADDMLLEMTTLYVEAKAKNEEENLIAEA
jgi:hypothetical protein